MGSGEWRRKGIYDDAGFVQTSGPVPESESAAIKRGVSVWVRQLWAAFRISKGKCHEAIRESWQQPLMLCEWVCCEGRESENTEVSSFRYWAVMKNLQKSGRSGGRQPTSIRGLQVWEQRAVQEGGEVSRALTSRYTSTVRDAGGAATPWLLGSALPPGLWALPSPARWM